MDIKLKKLKKLGDLQAEINSMQKEEVALMSAEEIIELDDIRELREIIESLTSQNIVTYTATQ